MDETYNNYQNFTPSLYYYTQGREEDLRERSLKMAIDAAEINFTHSTPETILVVAEQFYNYIKGNQTT